MAGGNFINYDKVLPGYYANYATEEELSFSPGTRGVVVVPKFMKWGADGVVIDISSPTQCLDALGYDYSDPELWWLREIFLGTNRTPAPSLVRIVRVLPAAAAKATVTISPLVCTAKYKGTRGNDIKVAIVGDPDALDSAVYYRVWVRTFVDDVLMDEQTVGTFIAASDPGNVQPTVAMLQNNAWVDFSGTGNLAVAAATALVGGADGGASTGDTDPDGNAIVQPTASEYAAVLDTLVRPLLFNILICESRLATAKDLFVSFIQDMGANEGKYCQVVTGYKDTQTILNQEYAIFIANGYTKTDGSIIDAQNACFWLGGAEAGCPYNASLTYAYHMSAADCYPRLSSSQMVAYTQAGVLCFLDNYGQISVCSDIDNLHSFTKDRGYSLSKNRIIRTLQTILNSIYEISHKSIIGAVDNNPDGRSELRAALIQFLKSVESARGIQNFTGGDESELAVSPGAKADEVIVDFVIQPVDSVEKIYNQIKVR